MLHIILFILKIIGFLILGILALLLLLTAVFLLAPFVYRAEFSADSSPESIRGSIRFHWLMHLISGHVSYEDGTFTWHIRAAWKKFGSEEDVRAESPPERREKYDHFLELSGNRFFKKSDFLVHRRPDFYMSVKMCSRRTIGNESVNSENILGRLTGHGATFFLTDGGPVAVPLTAADRKAISAVYRCYENLAKIAKLKKETEEAYVKIRFYEQKSRERRPPHS